MESNNREMNALRAAAAAKDIKPVDEIELTFTRFETTATSHTPTPEAALVFPPIDAAALDQALSRTPQESAPVEVVQGNKPWIPDVQPETKTVHAVETDPAVLKSLTEDISVDLMPIKEGAEPGVTLDYTKSFRSQAAKDTPKSLKDRLRGFLQI